MVGIWRGWLLWAAFVVGPQEFTIRCRSDNCAPVLVSLTSIYLATNFYFHLYPFYMLHYLTLQQSLLYIYDGNVFFVCTCVFLCFKAEQCTLTQMSILWMKSEWFFFRCSFQHNVGASKLVLFNARGEGCNSVTVIWGIFSLLFYFTDNIFFSLCIVTVPQVWNAYISGHTSCSCIVLFILSCLLVAFEMKTK